MKLLVVIECTREHGQHQIARTGEHVRKAVRKWWEAPHAEVLTVVLPRGMRMRVLQAGAEVLPNLPEVRVVYEDADEPSDVPESVCRVHLLERGVALCGFMQGIVPAQWPPNHKWTGCDSASARELLRGVEDGHQLCPDCRAVHTEVERLLPRVLEDEG